MSPNGSFCKIIAMLLLCFAQNSRGHLAVVILADWLENFTISARCVPRFSRIFCAVMELKMRIWIMVAIRIQVLGHVGFGVMPVVLVRHLLIVLQVTMPDFPTGLVAKLPMVRL